jgi:hypothetical protein
LEEKPLGNQSVGTGRATLRLILRKYTERMRGRWNWFKIVQ